MIIMGLALIEARSGLPLISRVDYGDQGFLHSFLYGIFSLTFSSSEISWVKTENFHLYFSPPNGIIVVIFAPKELQRQKVNGLIYKIKEQFGKIFSQLPEYAPIYFETFHKILDEILEEQYQMDSLFRWIPMSLFRHPLMQRLKFSSLTALNDASCPFCGAQRLVTGQTKKTQKTSIFCPICENWL
ncbi:MAG: hypothetical protein ACFFBD_11550 [Candidatus Hodarchaeota archaeon]